MAELKELHLLTEELCKRGFSYVGTADELLSIGEIVQSTNLSYNGEDFLLQFFKGPGTDNESHNWITFRDFLENDNERMVDSRRRHEWFAIIPVIYKPFLNEELIGKLPEVGPNAMHIIYSEGEVRQFKSALEEFGKRIINGSDVVSSEISFRNGQVSVKYAMGRASGGRNIACNLESDLQKESISAYKAEVLPYHVEQKIQEHFCIPTEQFPIFPLNFKKIGREIDFYMHNADNSFGSPLDRQRMTEIFSGMPISNPSLICLKDIAGSASLVALDKGLYLTTRLYGGSKGRNYSGAAEVLSRSMDAYIALYSSFR